MDSSEANACFDSLNDDLFRHILSKIPEAKSLASCLCVSKRFNFVVSQINTIYLNFFPVPRSLCFRSLLSLLHIEAHPPSMEGPCRCPHKLLKSFTEIKSLHVELPSYATDVTVAPGHRSSNSLLKWRANFGTGLRFCVVLSATSFHRRESPATDVAGSSQPCMEAVQENDPLTTEELKSQLILTLFCLTAASRRHQLLRKVVPEFPPTLKSVAVTDSTKEGKLWMEEEQLQSLRVSSKTDEIWLGMKIGLEIWHVPELELPPLGWMIKGLTVVVIRPVDQMMVVDGGFDGDEPQRYLLKAVERLVVEKESNYAFQMPWI